jgi:hypothetical protein
MGMAVKTIAAGLAISAVGLLLLNPRLNVEGNYIASCSTGWALHWSGLVNRYYGINRGSGLTGVYSPEAAGALVMNRMSKEDTGSFALTQVAGGSGFAKSAVIAGYCE